MFIKQTRNRSQSSTFGPIFLSFFGLEEIKISIYLQTCDKTIQMPVLFVEKKGFVEIF